MGKARSGTRTTRSTPAANPATRLSIVQLFGTGEGATDPAGVDGQLALSVYPKPKHAHHGESQWRRR